jgi:hypothetical protein
LPPLSQQYSEKLKHFFSYDLTAFNTDGGLQKPLRARVDMQICSSLHVCIEAAAAAAAAADDAGQVLTFLARTSTSTTPKFGIKVLACSNSQTTSNNSKRPPTRAALITHLLLLIAASTSADDSFCVKDGSSNMLFERLTSSGLGLTIGSIGGSTVRNITFRSVLSSRGCVLSHACAINRDIYMPDTFKVPSTPPLPVPLLHYLYPASADLPLQGIYLKFRGSGGLITDILYANTHYLLPPFVTSSACTRTSLWTRPRSTAATPNTQTVYSS